MQYISLGSQIISGLERKLLWGYGLYSFSFTMPIFFWAKAVFNSINLVFNSIGLHINISIIWECIVDC